MINIMKNTHYYNKINKRLLLSCFISSLALGCAHTHKDPLKTQTEEISPNNESFNKPIRYENIKYEGSLWEPEGDLSELFINPIARKIGDIVTIKISEKASAFNKADTDTERESSLTASVGGDWNWVKKLIGSTSGSIKREFAGKGTTNRSGNLIAEITAMVTEVLPNGNLRIRGSRDVTVNNEKQLIILTGIIRPRDISTNNVIESSRIANAKIAYNGAGVLQETQSMGWVSRALNWVRPF